MTPDSGPKTRGDRGWLQAVGLLLVAWVASVGSPTVLIAIPFLLLVIALPVRRPALVLAGAFAVLFIADAGWGGGVWYLERGWAVLVGGWFLGLTLRWPASRFFPRALGAVAGAFAVAALMFRVRPRSWAVVDWTITSEMQAWWAQGIEAFRMIGGSEALSPAFVETVYRTAETQTMVFPALVGVASLASLGVAWWGWVRLARGEGDALGPVREFRFHDHLVWILILGVALVLTSTGGAWDRLGTNTVVFMGALYALRGVAVVLFLMGGVSVGAAFFFAVALLFLAPVLAAGALAVGVGDTWLDLRERARAMANPDG